MKTLFRNLAAALSLAFVSHLTAEEPLQVLLIDGQNNHDWEATSPVLVQILRQSDRFNVTVTTTPPSAPKAPRPPKKANEQTNKIYAAELKAWEQETARHKAESESAWKAWRPDFSIVDVVVSNYNGELWPKEVRDQFEAYVKGGGGFVSVHAADNAFPDWPAYNEMIGVGGWGGRSALSGPYLRMRDGEWTTDPTEGRGGSHGKRHQFLVETQNEEHPIMKGLPTKWLHAEDELYDRLRGPAKNVTVLAAAMSDEATGGSGEMEPVLMAINYGEGRVFHTTLGHNVMAISDVGFQETLKRGTEWAATGEVTFPDVSDEEMSPDRVFARDLKLAAQ